MSQNTQTTWRQCPATYEYSCILSDNEQKFKHKSQELPVGLQTQKETKIQ